MNEFNLALLVVRVWVGIVMFAHGVKHLRGREKTTNWLRGMGFQKPELNWIGMSFGEMAAGIGIAVGLLTSFAAAAYLAILVVAFVSVHRRAGFWITARPDEGWEYVASLAAAVIVIAILGPGEWSIDNGLDIIATFDGYTGLWIALAGAVAGLGQAALFYRPKSVS